MHMRSAIIAGLVIVAALAGGCEPWRPFDKEPAAATEATPEATPLAVPLVEPEASPAQTELTQRDQELAALQEAYAGLEGQHRQLAEEAQELQWVNDQLLQTIRDLDSTIEERDRLTLSVEQLRVENLRLTKKIQGMEAELVVY